MLKFFTCVLLIACLHSSYGRRLHRRQATEQVQPVALIPPATGPVVPQGSPVATESGVPPQPAINGAPIQSQSVATAPVIPVQAPPQLLVPVQPAPPQVPQQAQATQVQPIVVPLSSSAADPNAAAQVPIVIQLPSGTHAEQATVIFQQAADQSAIVQPSELQQGTPEWFASIRSRQPFAKEFEFKPIGGQPDVQFIGAEQARQQLDDNAARFQQNLAVIRPSDKENVKLGQAKLSVPLPPQRIGEQDQLKQRIQNAVLTQTQFSNAGRDREAFLAKINVTGNQLAANEFIRQLKNLSDFKEKQPFASLEIMTGLINAELSLTSDNWIINEEIAGELAASFKIPRESANNAIVLTPADVDEMKFHGNNPTAAKTFHVKLQELLWAKVDQQYRVTTDLLAMFSDALLNLLVGNGIVKEKFAEDIAALFYRANSKKIKLF